MLDGQDVLEMTGMLDYNDVTLALHAGLGCLLQAEGGTETAGDATANNTK